MAHVVIADGDYGELYLHKVLLNSLGWSYDAATDGAEAWQKAQEVVPDLVIAEINLSGMSGLDLVLTIKSDPRFALILVVLMGTPENEAAAGAAGCDAFVAKPFGGQTILRLLPQLVREDSTN
jgi:CheY-like chemotaxis protein